MTIGIGSVNAKDCSSYKSEDKCTEAAGSACIWNSKYKFCSSSGLVYVACGNGSKNLKSVCGKKEGTTAYDIPYMIPSLTAFTINVLKIATPIVLIFVGMIQMIKALTSTAEDEIKKVQGLLVKKIVIAVMIFFVISITQFVIDLVSDSSNSDEAKSAGNCLNCFVNDDCPLIYYRSGDNQQKCVSLKK